MTHTRITHSDAYYVAQLLERLEGLEKQLSNKLSTNAELTQRTRHLLKDLHLLLTRQDDLAQELLEFNFMPKINRLLLDARQQLKLRVVSSLRGGTPTKQSRNNPRLLRSYPRNDAVPIYPAPYKPIPMPLRDEQRHALIEDALTKLKMLLSLA